MSQIEKLINRLKSNPKDFKYSELCRVMCHFGYEEDTGGKTSGSAVSFVDPAGHILFLHRPHPGNEMYTYMVNKAVQHLKERNLI